MTSLILFFKMGGYGVYIWSAYASVFTFLFLQWFMPWRSLKKWKKIINEQAS